MRAPNYPTKDSLTGGLPKRITDVAEILLAQNLEVLRDELIAGYVWNETFDLVKEDSNVSWEKEIPYKTRREKIAEKLLEKRMPINVMIRSVSKRKKD